MVTLTEDMKAAFNTIQVFPVATASKGGIPNVVPIGFVSLIDDSTIWIADNFMQKTLLNIIENPKVSIYIWGPKTNGSFQIKGDVELKTSGPEFEKMQEIVHSKMAQAPAKSLFIMKITDVYDCSPGPDAGNKLL
ncbi:pyridoxamine 5'-phosphate oxidase family protein [Methanococcoides burtonii]|uniref:Pyridoxamine 5'-phosphate oxidase-related, FMN-binding n=1 Tax=Methanococcoides burtonii (strain DSM 6242 / NBRC 107633 / OCM 468 / ACE-M) TaxID=259564 RepID=Q12VG9_METBU|nr:pyridoxamine 5'-phosphate oxidase family protein [Methanococcoides burtonii]ABE52557.1 pyridoxamine 5'-phosphate oxidase-related, FMN-binding [Methanococcoides burtonii DSM 6242]